jgi:glutamine amidotransferase
MCAQPKSDAAKVSPLIGIVDYNAGNIRSVEHALNRLGIPNIVSKKPNDLCGAQKLIFPGVGDARYAMGELKKTGFDLFLKDETQKGTPILGICLGSQIIFDYSEEGDVDCLGLVHGTIRHIRALWKETPDESAAVSARAQLKVPHMGWNDVTPTKNGKACLLFAGLNLPQPFYFVHSYVIVAKDFSVVAGVANYGIAIPAAIQSQNVFALQFHPEKSGETGLAMLKNFCTAKINAAPNSAMPSDTESCGTQAIDAGASHA